MLKQKEWIDVIVTKTGCSKKEAKLLYDCVFEYIKEQVTVDESVKLQGLGVFKLRKTAAKEQINLITGQAEIVPEHNVVTFKPYFEIDPKPEAIEVENEEIIEEVPVVEEPVIEEVVEEAPVDAEEEVVEVIKEEAVESEEVEEDAYTWLFAGKEYTTLEMIALLQEKTALTSDEIRSSLDVVKANMSKVNKTSCEVRESDETFDFVIVK